MAEYEARNVAEQRVLVQEAILELINDADDIIEQMMRARLRKSKASRFWIWVTTMGKAELTEAVCGRLANGLAGYRGYLSDA